MIKSTDVQIRTQLNLSEQSSKAIEQMTVTKIGLDASFVTRRMHLTVNHADKFLSGAREVDECETYVEDRLIEAVDERISSLRNQPIANLSRANSPTT